MVNEREEAIKAVVEACVNPGVQPGYHRFMKSKLMKEWPTLAMALRELVVHAGDDIGDEYHTMNELYDYRMMWHAHAINAWEILRRETDHVGGIPHTVKSFRHSDETLCFGGGWFIVVSTMTTGEQISNHYKNEHWDLFKCDEVWSPPKYDGHNPQDVLDRLVKLLTPPREFTKEEKIQFRKDWDARVEDAD